MFIKRLVLDNIRSYVHEEISFPKGSLLLSGDIGSGKSSILQGIEFALFGTQRGVLEASNLLRKGENDASVCLDFEMGSKKVSVCRTIKKGAQGPGYLIIDGLKEDLMPSELKNRVLELLGYPNPLIFRYSVYASQEQMKQIILEKPEVRLNLLRVLFGVDNYKQIIENSSLVLRDIRKNTSYLEGVLVDIDSKKEDLLESKKKVIDFESKVKVLENDLLIKEKDFLDSKTKFDCVSKELVMLDSEKKELELIKQQVMDLEQREGVIKSQIDDLNIVLSKTKEESLSLVVPKEIDLEDLISKVKSLEDSINRNKNLKEVLSQKFDILGKQLVTLEKQVVNDMDLVAVLGKLQQERGRLETVKNARAVLQQVELKLNSSKVMFEQKQKQRQNLFGLSTCPTCKQDVGDGHKTSVLSDLDSDIESVRQDVVNFSDEVKRLGLEVQKIDGIEKNYQELLNKKSVLEEKLNQSKEAVIEKESVTKDFDLIKYKLDIVNQFDFSSFEKELLELKAKEESARKASLIKQRKENLDKTALDKESQIMTLKNELEGNFSKKEILNKSVNSLTDRLVNYDSKLSSLNEAKLVFEKKSQDFESSKINFETIKKDLDYSKKEFERLSLEVESKLKDEIKLKWNRQLLTWLNEFFVPVMKVIEKRVLEQIHYEFLRSFSDWFNILIEDDSMQVSIDSAFTPVVRQGDYDLEVSSLSGGERTSVALAYRLALNRIVNELIPSIRTKELLILDEPTEGFSNEQLDRVKVVLDLLRVNQLIIVSHEQKVDGFVSHLMRIEKEQNKSRIC